MTLRDEIIAALNVRPDVDPATEIRARIDFLKEYVATTGVSGLVLGISGGQDSSLAGRLSQLAAEELRAGGFEGQFTAMRLPYGVQRDEEDAQLALEFIAPDRLVTFDVAGGVDGVTADYGRATGHPLTDFSKGNVKARLRMVAQYAVAGDHRLLVVGTDHAAEAVTGFFTKFGDGGADVLPLSGLTKRQGKALLRELGAPERLYEKAPTADLLDGDPGQTDESSLGLTYEQIDDYLEGREVDAKVAGALESRYLATRHKREAPVTMFDEWWRQ